MGPASILDKVELNTDLKEVEAESAVDSTPRPAPIENTSNHSMKRVLAASPKPQTPSYLPS